MAGAASDSGDRGERVGGRGRRPYLKPAADSVARNAAAERAGALRRVMSPPEQKLWQALRGRRLGGFKFRRQHPLGPYVADFSCVEAGLVVEVDGSGHLDRVARDAHRDAWMREHGLQVVRVTGSDVLKNLDGVLSTVLGVARERLARCALRESGSEAARPSPGSAGEGGRQAG